MTKTFDDDEPGVIDAVSPVSANVLLDDKLWVECVAATTCKMRNAPRRRFMLAAVSTSPAVKLLGRAVGVAIGLPYPKTLVESMTP